MSIFLAFACSSEKHQVKSPIDELVKQMDKEKNFGIILYDMDIEEKTFGDDVFKHQYKIITEKGAVPTEEITGWYNVSKGFFLQNENNMGMEIASKNEGVLSKIPAPPGFNRYVGNERYGSWSTGSDGNSFWAFYGQYAMMSSMLGLASNMMYRNSYNDYHNNYMGRQPYYGQTSGGRPAFGTYSAHGASSNPNFAKRVGSASAFKEKVNNRLSRSSGSSSSSGSRLSDDKSKSKSSSSSSSSSKRSSSRRRR
ncbi:MAG: hypothetical protein EAZ08_02025 [Cytophagales bacterium]|nr:MAG: hypothetical protein EAZ08_02025 [Cytophagales bacterium]